MKYYQFTINTETPESIIERLTMEGIYSYSIYDPADVNEIIDNKEKYKWDYISDGLKVMAKINVTKIKVYFEDIEEAKAVRSKFSDCETSLLELDDDMWKYMYKDFFTAHEITNKLKIAPTWECDQISDDTVILDPGMAFGTGRHETTAMCAQLMSELDMRGKSLLDVGTGSGILAIIGKKLGAGHVLGVDLDSEAIKSALENIKINGYEDEIVIKEGNLVEGIDFKADVVCGNLVAELVCELAEAIKSNLNPGGVFISSGILKEKSDMVQESLEKYGYTVDGIIKKNQWVAIKATID